MKIRILTKRQLAEEEKRFKDQHQSTGELLKLVGRLLTVTREARDYLKQCNWESKYQATSKTLSYDDLMVRLNSLLNGRK